MRRPDRRLCPSCEQKRILLFAEKVTDEILPAVPHRFWTFGVPKVLRGILLGDLRLLKLIPRCDFEAVKQTMKETLARGVAGDGTPGAIRALHTAPADPKDPAFFHMLRTMKRPTAALSRIAFDPDSEKVI